MYRRLVTPAHGKKGWFPVPVRHAKRSTQTSLKYVHLQCLVYRLHFFQLFVQYIDFWERNQYHRGQIRVTCQQFIKELVSLKTLLMSAPFARMRFTNSSTWNNYIDTNASKFLGCQAGNIFAHTEHTN